MAGPPRASSGESSSSIPRSRSSTTACSAPPRGRIEIPVGGPEDDLLRVSAAAAYTTRQEIERVLAALVRELDAEHRQKSE